MALAAAATRVAVGTGSFSLTGTHRRALRGTLGPAGKSLPGCSSALCLCLWPPPSPWKVLDNHLFPYVRPEPALATHAVSAPHPAHGCGEHISFHGQESSSTGGVHGPVLPLCSPFCQHSMPGEERGPRPSPGSTIVLRLPAGSFCCFGKGAKTPTMATSFRAHNQGAKPCGEPRGDGNLSCHPYFGTSFLLCLVLCKQSRQQSLAWAMSGLRETSSNLKPQDHRIVHVGKDLNK